MSVNGLIRDDTGVSRCWWAGSDPLYLGYHDEEWGRPITNDSRLFEKSTLTAVRAVPPWNAREAASCGRSHRAGS